MYCVYKHTNLINNKIYIGQTCQEPERRWGINGIGYRYQPKFYNAIQKYGWKNFSHQILKDNLTLEQANILEIYYIHKYDSIRNGYNIRSGGGSQAGTDNPMYGKHHSQETKEKISQKKRDIPNTFEQKEKIRQATLGGKNHSAKKIKCIENNTIYDAATDAARILKLGSSPEAGGRNIRKVVRGERETAYGYHWESAENK